MPDSVPLVSINCCCYNQSPYIAKTLDGFVMQKTNFKFEAIIHDDASTDGTAEIVRQYALKYPNIIKPIFESENQYSKHDGSLRRIVNSHLAGKYVAMCEGDDFWTDPYKLQKQVDFLESHPDYGMCFTKAKIFDQKKGKIIGNFGSSYTDFESMLYKGNPVPTLTTVFKKELKLQYEKDIKPEMRHWKMGDYPMWLWFAKKSKVYFLPHITATYRLLPESASHSKDINKLVDFKKSYWEIKNFFIEKYDMKPIPSFDEHRELAQIYISNGTRKQVYDEFKLCKRNGIKDQIKIIVYSNPILYVLYNYFLRIRMFL